LYGNGIKAEGVDPNRHNWDVLSELYKGGITFKSYLDPRKGFAWRITETLDGDTVFDLVRDKMTLTRYTDTDRYGLLGLSAIDRTDRAVILTEGVSDYFTAKILCPESNVLGVTTLTGSHAAKAILVNLFDTFTICTDNDTGKERNTGYTNSSRFREFLESYGKTVNIFLPSDGYKDISDNFVGKLRRNG
jgi:hypothetical protein